MYKYPLSKTVMYRSADCSRVVTVLTWAVIRPGFKVRPGHSWAVTGNNSSSLGARFANCYGNPCKRADELTVDDGLSAVGHAALHRAARSRSADRTEAVR